MIFALDPPSEVALPEWVEWVSALGPVITLLAAVIAGWIAVVSLRQRSAADAKAEWWRRTQWAFEQFLSGDEERRTVGGNMLASLADSELATEEDLDLYQAAWDDALDDVPAEQDDAEYVIVDEGSGDHDTDR